MHTRHTSAQALKHHLGTIAAISIVTFSTAAPATAALSIKLPIAALGV